MSSHGNERCVQRRKDFLVFGSPRIDEDAIAEVVACLRSGWIGTGPRVQQFEDAFCTYKQAGHAVAVNSCTAALHLSVLAAGLQPGDEVITSPLTFCATVNAIVHAGLTPVLADVDPDTMNIDPRRVADKITARTRAIIPVHFAGRPCDMTSLCAVARRHNLKVIEDCAHAIESRYRDVAVGTIGDFGCFSFYVTKNITTGEGGMVLTANEADQARIRTLALHGMSKDAWKRFGDSGYQHYDVVECGFKYNMTDMQAALGLRQLEHVERFWQRRRGIWQRYRVELADLPVGLPAEPEPHMRHAYHLFTILIDPDSCGISRDAFLDAMTGCNIGVGVHYLSIPEHPYYQRTYGWKPEDYPHAARIGRQIVSIPLSAKLTDEDVSDVIAAVDSIINSHSRSTVQPRSVQ